MSDKHIQRRLAVILIADIVGYSRLMSLDATKAVRILQEHRFSVIEPVIGQYQGRIVRLMGDGMLVEFQSVMNAVECAISIQLGIVKRNADTPADRQMRYRIGVNLGEILIEKSDIHGDGINIAARLEQLAEPDSVCISSAVFAQLDDATQDSFVEFGVHHLKNIAKPVHAFIHTVDGAAAKRDKTFRPFIDLPVEGSPKASGGCLCGKIRYEVSEPGLGSMYCHCRMCQRFTGAPLMAGTVFKTQAVRLLQGETKFFRSSSIAERGFCSDCGASLFYRGLVGKWTEWLMVFSASLDDPENYPPTYHLGVESKMPWLELHDDLPRTSCKDSPSLVQAYHSVGEEVP